MRNASQLGPGALLVWVRHAALRMLAFGLPLGLIAGLVYGPVFGIAAGVVTGVATVRVIWLRAALPAVSYLVVHRALRRAGVFPGRSLTDFLDWCVAHRLLLPVGYGYRFLHPTFQEHLARQRSDSGGGCRSSNTPRTTAPGNRV